MPGWWCKAARTAAVAFAFALAAVTAGSASGCDCQGEASDSGVDSGPVLLPTVTVVAIASSLTNIAQLHVIATTLPPAMGEPCNYEGMMYEGWIPEIVAGGVLDASCPNDPFGCPTFYIHWTGPDLTSTPLGGFSVTGIGEISCQIDVYIEALDALGAVLSSATTNDAYAFYGVSNGPRSIVYLP